MRTVKGKITWIDIVKPNDGDIAAVKKEHAFHPIILDEIHHPSSRARLERYDSYLFLIYHLPVHDATMQTPRRAEIDFLITKNKIITVHYEHLESLDALFQSLLRDEALRKNILGSETFLPLHFILQECTAFALRQLRHIEERVSFVANEIFNHKEEVLLQKISYIKRDILDYRLIVRPQAALFHLLKEKSETFWGDKSRVYIADIAASQLRIQEALENYYEMIESLETTNAQLLDAETNKVIKRMTTLGFLFSAPLFLIFLSEIKYVGDIFLATPGLFWTEFFVIGTLLVWLTLYFKKKKIL